MKLAALPVLWLLSTGLMQDAPAPDQDALQARASALRPSFDELGRACLDLYLDQGCGPASVGFLTDAPDGGRLYWQIQEGASSTDGVGGGIVILRQAGDRLEPILQDFQAWRYAAPELVTDGDAETPLLVLRGTSRAASPMDLVWQWRGGGWRKVDTEAWQDQVPAQADGLTVQSGVRIDYASLRGVTPLWRDRDGACCPTGGWADLRFDLRDGVLHLAEVRRSGASSSTVSPRS